MGNPLKRLRPFLPLLVVVACLLVAAIVSFHALHRNQNPGPAILLGLALCISVPLGDEFWMGWIKPWADPLLHLFQNPRASAGAAQERRVS